VGQADEFEGVAVGAGVAGFEVRRWLLAMLEDLGFEGGVEEVMNDAPCGILSQAKVLGGENAGPGPQGGARVEAPGGGPEEVVQAEAGIAPAPKVLAVVRGQ